MSSKFTFYLPSSDGRSRIHGIQWVPSVEVKAVIVVAHGMIEHIGRYEDFANAMNEAGVAVIGHDHLGHGRTALPGTLGQFAKENGAFYVLSDMKIVADYARRQYPNVRCVLLGHSMGSFFGRRFITRYGAMMDGAIFVGTGSQPAILLKIASYLVEKAVVRDGREYCDEKLHRLVLGSYNKRFEKGKTEHQWLSRDEASNRSY